MLFGEQGEVGMTYRKPNGRAPNGARCWDEKRGQWLMRNGEYRAKGETGASAREAVEQLADMSGSKRGSKEDEEIAGRH